MPADDLRKPVSAPDQCVNCVGDLRDLALAALGDWDLRVSGVALVRATLTVGAVSLDAAIAAIRRRDRLISVPVVQGEQRVAVLLPFGTVPHTQLARHAHSLTRILQEAV